MEKVILLGRRFADFILRCLQQKRNKGYYKTFVRQVQLKEFTAEQEKEIQTYWKELVGHKISLKWHQLFYSITGVFSVEYMPPSIYNAIISKLNDRLLLKAYDDKNIYVALLNGINKPQRILQCSNGYFYKDSSSLTKAEALSICQNLKSVVIKPSMNSSAGHNVCALAVTNGVVSCGEKKLDGLSVEELFDNYGLNFLIEEKIEQHPLLAQLNPSSCQTIRVISIREGDEIIIVNSVLRIGRSTSLLIDNFSSGGIACKVDNEGVLSEYGYSLWPIKKFTHTDNNVQLKGYRVPNYDEVTNMVKKAHYRLPHFKTVAWDVCVDVQGKALILEYNVPYGAYTLNLATNTVFGNYTKEIVSMVYSRL